MADFYQMIYDILCKERDAGVTQNEMSRRSGVAQSRICRILDSRMGITNIKRLGLETFFKLFPDAQIVFGGDRRIGDVHHNTNSPVIQGDGNTVAAQPSEETASAFLQRIMAAPDIDAETKVKIFNLHSRRPFN